MEDRTQEKQLLYRASSLLKPLTSLHKFALFLLHADSHHPTTTT